MRARLIGLIGLSALLEGCVLPPSHNQHFAVTGETASNPPPTLGFHNTDPDIPNQLANNICADGYEKLSENTLPATDNRQINEQSPDDQSLAQQSPDHQVANRQFKEWHVRCLDRVWGFWQTTG